MERIGDGKGRRERKRGRGELNRRWGDGRERNLKESKREGKEEGRGQNERGGSTVARFKSFDLYQRFKSLFKSRQQIKYSAFLCFYLFERSD